ncbi:SKIV2-like protein [Mya arenaria]|uniref:SKIV2-like protein n=1 Tax=Mya arenaria TaxID=6604 RepID=A0ABY7G9E7_MYAAR|nr:SKIV2-like protein [Mya arenaria]
MCDVVELLSKEDEEINPIAKLPLDAPPIIPRLEDELERFLTDPESIPIHDIDRAQRFTPRVAEPLNLLHVDLCPVQSTIQVERNPTTGQLVGYREAYISDTGQTARNSLSLKRAPDPDSDSVRGNTLNFPFWPDLLTVAPGLEEGMTFHDPIVKKEASQSEESSSKVMTLADIMTLNDDIGDLDLEGDDEEEKNEAEDKQSSEVTIQRSESFERLVEPAETTKTPEETKSTRREEKEEWAFKVDVDAPVDDFYKRVPDMAYNKWPFEPDVFQKQAILHLEAHESVFVAAHTSAGKTVALSNQKYRDFKHTFSDVGLITGDVQINQTASCLIMTTEILRSMLYNGSDVIRDLEWVIFDEVHYINDAERGVVWEEVLIMLPQHVNIILLSATVPNTLEFAAWIGRTKKKKIYVISTTKRPVPLEHYLYTGNSNKTSNEQFKVVDAKGSFSTDKNVWLSVIEMLKKKDKLPVVAFTFSKKKIEENCQNLRSLDLTVAKEKSEIHIFFHQSIKRLKGSADGGYIEAWYRDASQWHSAHTEGSGGVTILFATETFAMGVNMPARTVVFDSTRKHDGTHFRDLLPGEYIQMAGRAGRRGLDTTGTVIILCKGDVPEQADLHKMMLGKPTKLESRFRLTYSMILNLLRVEQLRVEDMMKRSFSEFHSQKDVARRKEDLDKLHTQITSLADIECFMCSVDLETYWETCRDFHELNNHLQSIILSHPAAIKALSPGRVVIVNTPTCSHVLGVVLKTGTTGANNERTFTVLVICDKNSNDASAKNSLSNFDSKNRNGVISDQSFSSDLVTPVLKKRLFQPEGACWHEIVQCRCENIVTVTTKTIRLDPEKIINDVKKREIPRFKTDPPSQSVTMASQELLRITEANMDGLPGLHPTSDLKLRDIDLVEKFRALELMMGKFESFNCFNSMSGNMKVKEDYRRLQYLLSDASLMLLPEYQQRVEVLKALNYIDQHNAVQLKGRVACEISTHELMITELVFENALTELHPTEIAALLSSMVFEQKNCSEPKLIYTLEKGKENILEKANQISRIQRQMGMQVDSEYADTFKFGLMEAVFEWARGLPFSDIITLTDVQEGIIVRCIQRLHETLRDVRNAARIIGDPVLYQKMEEASTMIKRDIVFAASLYTQ